MGAPWFSKEELIDAKKMHDRGLNWNEIARRLGRERGAGIARAVTVALEGKNPRIKPEELLGASALPTQHPQSSLSKDDTKALADLILASDLPRDRKLKALEAIL